MIKRSFSVVMLALMVAPTYAMFGADELAPTKAMKKASKKVGDMVRNTIQSVSVDETQTPAAPQAPKNAIETAKDNLNNHIEKENSPSEDNSAEEPKKNDAPEDKGSEAPEKTEEENKSEEPKSGFIARCADKLVGGLVSSKNAVAACASAVGAGIYAGASKTLNAGLSTGKFAVATVDPRTYWNAGKAIVKGQDGVSRFAIIRGHKEAVTGIVAATLASVGYVYREEIVEYGKKAYNWSANQVQSLRNYIQGQ